MKYYAEYDDQTGSRVSTQTADDLAVIIVACKLNSRTARVYQCRVPGEEATRYLAYILHWSGKVTIASR